MDLGIDRDGDVWGARRQGAKMEEGFLAAKTSLGMTGSLLRSSGLEGEVGGLPGDDAARDFADVGEIGALEETGGNGGAVATGTVDEQRAIFGEHGEILEKMSEREAEATGDESFLALTG